MKLIGVSPTGLYKSMILFLLKKEDEYNNMNYQKTG